MALRDRVEGALRETGIPQAGHQQRGWIAESGRGTVRLFWGYGDPALKAAGARSPLGQCTQVLTRAGFQLRAPDGKEHGYIEILGETDGAAR